MATHPALIQFFRAILTAKRSLKLYPEGSRQAAAWAPRFRRALTDAVDRGLAFPIAVGRDRFVWPGGEMRTTDQAMEALRFDFQSRGIVSFSIDAAVVDWELRVFLELLGMPPQQLPSLFGAPVYLRSRGVIGITVGVPTLSGESDYSGSPVRTSGDEVVTKPDSRFPPLDSLEAFADLIVASVEEHLKDLVYDRSRLADWFGAIFSSGGLDAFFAGVRMLGSMAENSDDRELRLRTILEAIFLLPPATFAPLISERLIPMSPYDLVAFNLLTQVTEQELRLITQYVSQEKLMTLSTDLVEFTWETGKRQRLVEAVTWSLHQSGHPKEREYSIPAPPDDSILNAMHDEIVASSSQEKLLERSIEILISLVFDDTLAEGQPRPVKALSQAMLEALSLNRPELCLAILREVIARKAEGPARPELDETIAELLGRAADPALVALIAEPLRLTRTPEQVETAVEYLRLIGEQGIEAFTELLAAESERRVRARMCEVLTRVGASAISILGEHASDPRWFLARNVVNILGRSRQPGAAAAVTVALDHPHPRVRIEAIRAALLIDSPGSTELILTRINDPDPSVQRAVISAVSRKGILGNVSQLRKFVLSPIRDDVDLEVKIEAINALVTIGTNSARSVLEELADRPVGFFARAPRRLKGLAREALGRFSPMGVRAQGELLER
jgi:HEAT repeat protein